MIPNILTCLFFLFFRFGPSNFPEAPPSDVFTPSLVRRPPPSQTRNQKVKYNFCVFCKNNGEDESYYLSHTLKVRKSQKKIVVSSIPPKNKLIFFPDFCPRGHSITTWTRRGGWGISKKSTLVHACMVGW